MNSIVYDGKFFLASPLGGPEFASPIEGDANYYIIRQRFTQFADDWEPLPVNSEHPDYPGFYIVEESERINAGGGVVIWQRTWAKPPPTHDEWETFAYNFIGYYGAFGVNTATVTGRDRRVVTVMSRLRHEYFLVDELIANPGDDVIYPLAGNIPVIPETKYLYWDLDPNETAYWTDYLGDDDVLQQPTVPSRTEYEGWITNAVDLRWESTVVSDTGGLPGQLVADESRVTRWLGNIYLRQTRYVLAQ